MKKMLCMKNSAALLNELLLRLHVLFVECRSIKEKQTKKAEMAEYLKNE